MFKFFKNTAFKIGVALVLSLALILAWQPLKGELAVRQEGLEVSQKHETIFANLDHYGNVIEMFTVNSFLRPDENVVDYGDYTKIINLTNDSVPQIEEDRIIFDAKGDGSIFRYQGTLENVKLPWGFEISYYLDDKAVEAAALAGASGKLRMLVAAAYNPEAHPYFAENFMVQIRIPFKMDKTAKIYAPDASIMFVGNTATVAFTLMPKSSREFHLEADVSDFSMDGIEIAAMRSVVPANENIDEIESGFEEMADGTQELIEGTQKLEQGMVELNDGVGELYEGAEGISQGLRGLSAGLDEFSGGLAGMESGLSDIAEGSEGFKLALNAMSNAMPQLIGGYKNIESGLDAMLANKDQLNTLALSLAQSQDPQARMLAEAMIMQLSGMTELRGGLSKANEGLISHAAGISEISTRFGEFSQGLRLSADGAQRINRGFSEINTASKRLSSGAVGLRDGLGELKDNIATLPEDVNKLAEGQKDLKEGVLLAKDEISKFAGEGEEVRTVSFISPLRAEAETVQFILRTPAIEAEKIVETEEHKEQVRNFWDRLLDLFRN
jgi:X-X-X-Leu-X-X-Gly heptad repeat protein